MPLFLILLVVAISMMSFGGLLTILLYRGLTPPSIFFGLATLLLLACGALAALLGITAVIGDDQIHVSKDGISFPVFMGPFIGFRCRRMWSELSQVGVLTGSDGCAQKLSLRFRSGEHLKLDVNGFESRVKNEVEQYDVEKFILACELFANDANIENEVIAFKDSLRNKSEAAGLMSYTDLWENEMTSRFHATVFVPLAPGTQLRNGSVKVVRQYAFGGLAAVYLAQLDGRELVILKEAVLPAQHDGEIKSKALELFEREARFLAALSHPCIARVIDHFQEDNRSYLLLERITGQNLRQLVTRQGTQKEETVLSWGREIAEILRYLHERQPPIIHRDLTPENLILGEDGKIHLIDFGAANEFLGTVTGTVIGKQAYIAPEQFRGKANTSSDIYAFGGTLYFLLTGKNPLAMSVMSPRDLEPELSSGVDSLVRSCTSQTSDKRPSAEELLTVLALLRQKTLPSGS